MENEPQQTQPSSFANVTFIKQITKKTVYFMNQIEAEKSGKEIGIILNTTKVIISIENAKKPWTSTRREL